MSWRATASATVRGATSASMLATKAPRSGLKSPRSSPLRADLTLAGPKRQQKALIPRVVAPGADWMSLLQAFRRRLPPGGSIFNQRSLAQRRSDPGDGRRRSTARVGPGERALVSGMCGDGERHRKSPFSPHREGLPALRNKRTLHQTGARTPPRRPALETHPGACAERRNG
jgi:hypothetical protein